MRIRLAVALACLLATPLHAVEPGEVRKFVEGSVSGVLDVLNNDAIERAAKENALAAAAEEMFDIPLMAKLILGREHWPKLSAKQRKEYTTLLEQQVLQTFYDKLDMLAGTKATYAEPVRSPNGRYSVSTEVSVQGERYVMIYKVYSKKGSLLIYDIEVEGISLIRSYGTQYKDFLRKASIDDLLAKLHEKGLAEPADLQAVER